MDFKLRTVLIGLLSLAVILAIYLLYSRASKAPQIDIDPARQFIDTVADSNVSGFDSEIGKIGNVGIAALKKPVFRHLRNGQVDRELGFEELLHQVKDEWEVEKPYINIYQDSFNCFITADRGKVQVETAAGRPSPKDATFTGNVVIHILPQSVSDIKESFIYLDDVAFVSEKSLLSTAGPLRFVSQNAQMLGAGLELIYNEELQRLEFFRIIHLESLRFKGSQAALFSPTAWDSNTPTQSIIADDAQKSKEILTAGRTAVEKRQGEYYKCLLSKNVVVDAPEQLVFAEDTVAINNIFWPKASDRQSSKAETASTDDVSARKVVVPKHSEPGNSSEKSGDIIVTCDNGVLITPMYPSRVQDSPDKLDFGSTVPDKKHLEKLDNIPGRTTFITRTIDYDVSTGDAAAPGCSELTFYTGSMAGAEKKETPTPIKVTAQKEVRFPSASNQTIFEGDCVCTMSRMEPNNIQQKYTLSAPKLVANLASQVAGKGSRIEHLTADGGAVKFNSVKTAKGQLLSGVELDCCKTDYDAGQELFVATGPGTIKLSNSKIPEPNEQAGRFSLRWPCYAFLGDFSTLKYFIKANQIIADAEPGRTLQIDYFPVVGGKSAQQVTVTAAHIEASFAQAADGQTELSSLTAVDTVTYHDGDNQFAGGKLSYDHKKAVMKIWGDQSQPCYYNGALVDQIEYDLNTGKVKFRVAGPGTLQLK